MWQQYYIMLLQLMDHQIEYLTELEPLWATIRAVQVEPEATG